MICPNCKTEYTNEYAFCPQCGVYPEPNIVASEITEAYPMPPIPYAIPNKSEFKRNFWLAVLISTLGSAVICGGGLLACIIIWIVQLSANKEGAHGWIAGMFAGIALTIALLMLLFGGCMALFMS